MEEGEQKSKDNVIGMEAEKDIASANPLASEPKSTIDSEASGLPAVEKLTIDGGEGDVVVEDILVEERRHVAEKTDECGLMAAAAASTEKEEQTHSKKSTSKLVMNEEELKDCVELIRNATESDPLIALDCEGDNLSRIGKIHLISVATRHNVFLVDIKELKSQPFDIGLRDIFENTNIKKLMFDCREDSDALFHQFNVKLEGVIDVQLLEVIKKSPEFQKGGHRSRRCDRLDEVVRVKSLLECVEMYTKSKRLIRAKRSNVGKLSNWGRRPLREDQLKYAKADVLSLFKLYDKLHPEKDEMERLETASAIYVDLKRSIASRVYDEFENNGYLPVDVIPPKGQTGLISAGITHGSLFCTKCKRIFPADEFSNTQVRLGKQLCRTCKRVKQDLDERESRRLNYERTQEMRRQRRAANMLYGYESHDTYYRYTDDDGDEILLSTSDFSVDEFLFWAMNR